MGCEMETEHPEDMDIVLSSMWPEDINEAGRQFNVERPGADQDMLEEVTIKKEPNIVDFKRLMELTNYSDKGNWQLAKLVRNWEYKQANAVRLLKEELENLSKQQQEVELKKLEILEEHRFEQDGYGGDKRPISILDENLKYLYQDAPRRKNDVIFQDEKVEIDAEYDSVIYWKQRAVHLEKLLEASLQREQILMEKLQESIENLERQSSPVEELSQVLTRADNFLHFVLQNAPVVIGHQDKELRYRFIFNHFPSLGEQQDRGDNWCKLHGMEVTDQVRKREKMAKLREEMAVQKAKETELNKTIHITEESMRAKQMLATMSHEIRSPLSGVVSMAEILSTTNLDKEQRQLLNVMLSSGDLVLQLINDILDLSKVESGVMKLEATKFRPREVVKHVLQTAAASLQKLLTLEGHVADDVPVEVIGDVLRIRQILTNLVSNAIKFTHEGKVGINLYVVSEPFTTTRQGSETVSQDQSTVSTKTRNTSSMSQNKADQNGSGHADACGTCENYKLNDMAQIQNGAPMDEDKETHPTPEERVVWIRCDVYDTGIGIPENAIPTLFKKYMQVGADTARKYGGTGLGLAICKQLVELMGGHLSVSSVEHHGSTFTFVLPYKVSLISDSTDDPDELSDMDRQDVLCDGNDDDLHSGVFIFQPRTLGSLFSSQSSGRIQKLSVNSYGFNASHKCNGLLEDSPSPSSNITYKETSSEEDPSTTDHAMEASSEPEISPTCCSGSDILNSAAKQEKSHPEANGRFHPYAHPTSSSRPCNNLDETSEAQVGYQEKTQMDRSSECSSSNSPEIPKAELKPKILLVEDNKINVMVTRSMMKQLGHDIDIVCNGEEAVRAVQRNSYHLILMDVCMPVMDGLQATRLIRSFEETGSWEDAIKAGIEMQLQPPHSASNSQLEKPRKRTPIIAMTANALSDSADECYANGMDSFVSKPVTFQNLKQCLQEYLPSVHL
ncbi:UNVERIFIED_CONTAM: Histidine kinase [Sesamum angustifolium]|uniref:histidine kinase n=1 Tax=Sesamum angustifolium TaxID=2727405 RepID=A0AAW2MAZ4_9LAMI